MRLISIFLSILLSGCAGQVAKTFAPFAVEFKGDIGRKTFAQDTVLCQQYASDYLNSSPGLDASQIASEGLTGAVKQLPSIPLSVYTPALGGLGGASGETLAELGLDSQAAKKVITICLHDKGQKSDLYHVYDPNN